jgi:AraC-like DNA-binding protein
MRVEHATSDPELAGEYTREAYGGSVDYRESRSLEFRHELVGDAQLSMTRTTIPTRLDSTSEPVGVPMVVRVRRGRYDLAARGHRPEQVAAGGLFLVDPTVPMHITTEHLDARVLTFDDGLLARAASQLQPLHPRIAFPRHRPVNAALERLWADAANQLSATVFADDDLYANDLVRAAQYAHVAMLTIVAFDLLAEEADERPASERTVRQATRFADEHVADPISVGDLAAAAAVSLRALQLAFERVLGMTPSAYLRRARLSSARAELVLATPTSASVAAIARRWGFANTGRFAAQYRTAFGELPRLTLER